MQLRAPERDFIFSATAKVYPLLQPYLAASASPLLDLRKWITVASGKHAGILRHYLRELSTFVSAATRPPTVAAAIAHLSSPSVVRTIATEVRLFAHNMREHNDLMERVIIAGARSARFEEAELPTVVKFVRAGILVPVSSASGLVPPTEPPVTVSNLLEEDSDRQAVSGATDGEEEQHEEFAAQGDENMFTFSAPVVRQVILLRRLRPVSRPLELRNSLFDFVIAALPRLDPSWLAKTAGNCLNKDLLPSEAFWQYACWKALSSALPKGQMSPDVGHAFDQKGRVDFYINHEFHWGIELTREGSRLDKHYARFFKGGVYHGLVTSGVIQQWLLINFCCKLPRKDIDAKETRVLHVVYAPDFKSVTVYQSRQPVGPPIVLVGEQADAEDEDRAVLARGMSSLNLHVVPTTPDRLRPLGGI